MKKILGILLSVCIIVTALPLMAVAEDSLDFSELNESISAAEKLNEKMYFNFVPVKRAIKNAKDFINITSTKTTGISEYLNCSLSGAPTQAHIDTLNAEINKSVAELVAKSTSASSYNGASIAEAGIYQASVVLKLYNLTTGSSFGWVSNDAQQIIISNLIYQKTSQYNSSKWNASTAKIVVDCDETPDIFQTGIRIGLTIPWVYSNIDKARWGVQLYPYTNSRRDGGLGNQFNTTTVTSQKGQSLTYTLCDSAKNTKPSAETSGGNFDVDAVINSSGGAYGEYSWYLKGAVPSAGDSVVVRVVGVCATWVNNNNLQEFSEWTDLTISSVSKTALRNAVNTQIYAEENYSAESYADYTEALSTAKQVLNNQTAEQSEIDLACTNLLNAIKSLNSNLDFSKLDEAVKNAEDKINGNYGNTSFLNVALFNALHTTFTSQQQINDCANNINYLLIKAFKNTISDKKTSTHKQSVNYANIMSSVISMSAVNSDSATSSDFATSDDIGSMVCTVSNVLNTVNGIRSIDRCYQYNENTSTAVYNLDRSKYTDLSQLGNIIYSGIVTNAETHQHSLCLSSTAEMKCYSNTSVMINGSRSGKVYSYNLTGGGFSSGTAAAWDTTSGIVATEHRAGLKGVVPDAGDSVAIRVMTRSSVSGYNNVNIVWSYYGWIDVVINSYDSSSLLNTVNTYINPNACYTAESYKAYIDALSNAVTTLENSKTQQEFNLAEQSLNRAIAQLELSDSQNENNCKYISVTQNSKNKVYFYVPEVIFLKTNTESYKSQNVYNHKSYINYFFDTDSKSAYLEGQFSNKGGIYFYRENATDVSLSFRYLNTDFLPMRAYTTANETTTAENYVNTNNSLSFYGSSRLLRPSNTTKSESSTHYHSTVDYLYLTLSDESLSPSLIAHSTGYYIEWTVTYTDPDAGEERTVVTYSYVHKTSMSVDETKILNRALESDKALLRSVQNRVLNMHDELGIQNGYQSNFCSTDNSEWQHFISLEKAAGKLLSRSNTLSYITIDNEVYTSDSLAYALLRSLNEISLLKKRSEINAKYLEIRQDELGRNFLFELSDNQTQKIVTEDKLTCSFGDNVIVSPPDIPGYEKIGFLSTTTYSAGNEIDASVLNNLKIFDGEIEEKAINFEKLEYTVLYRAKEFSSLVNTDYGSYNYLRIRTTDLPDNLGGIGYPSYRLNQDIETDISYDINQNSVTVWTEGPTKSEKYQYLPFYAELEKNTEYVLTYDVIGASKNSIQFTAYCDSFRNGNSFRKDTYIFEENGDCISTGSDSGTTYFRIELLGDSRNGQPVEVKNICLSKATNNELYLQTSEQYPESFTATKTDKMGMSYSVNTLDSFTAISQYNSLIYTQRQLLPFYVVLKPGVNYSIEYTVDGLDKSDITLSLYNAEFCNANDGNGKYYTSDAYGNFTSADDGIAQLRIQYADGIDKDTAVTISNIKITNLDSKTVLSGTYNQTVSLGIPVKEGYKFAGWQLKSNGDGNIYGSIDTENNTYTFGAGTDLIEATWELDITPGDVNLDGKTDGMDTVLIRCIVSGTLSDGDLKKIQFIAADANSDGLINDVDAQLTENLGVFIY